MSINLLCRFVAEIRIQDFFLKRRSGSQGFATRTRAAREVCQVSTTIVTQPRRLMSQFDQWTLDRLSRRWRKKKKYKLFDDNVITPASCSATFLLFVFKYCFRYDSRIEDKWSGGFKIFLSTYTLNGENKKKEKRLRSLARLDYLTTSNGARRMGDG